MRAVRYVSVALALLAGPAFGQRDSLPGSPGSRASAVDAASDKLVEMSKVLSGSREKPERAVKAWDGLTAELWEAWREGKPPAGSGGAPGERGAKRPHETFLGEWTTGGRELLVFRQGLVQKTDGLQAAIDAFPARRSEWLARMDDASRRMGLGEKALAELSPKVAAVQEAVDRVVVAKNVAVNVAADTQAIRDQVQREYGKKETMPTGVTNVLGRFAKAPELHPGAPESWQRSMLDAASSTRKAFEQNGATRTKYDATYAVLVQQQLFEPVGRFKGLAFKDLPAPPLKLEADLRTLLKKLGERKVTPEDLEKEKQRNATECKAFYEWLRSDREKTKRAAQLSSARVCGAYDCQELRLESARGNCSADAVRDLRLRSAQLGTKRSERQAALRQKLELEIESGSKSFTPEKKRALLDEIEALNRSGDEETALWRQADAAYAGTDPECLKAFAVERSRCDDRSPECTAGRAPYDALVREIEAKEKEMWKSKADRDKRRKALGLPADENWDDCPSR